MKQLNFSLSAEARWGEARWWSIIFFHSLINRQHHWGCQCLTRDKQRGCQCDRRTGNQGQPCRWSWDCSNLSCNSLPGSIIMGLDPGPGYPLSLLVTAKSFLHVRSFRKQLPPSPASIPSPVHRNRPHRSPCVLAMLTVHHSPKSFN